jgi:hypothetical protein
MRYKSGGNNQDKIACGNGDKLPHRFWVERKNNVGIRWHDNMLAVPTSTRQWAKRSGAWTGDEDGSYRNLLQLHGGKDWVAIAALVQVEREFSVRRDGMLSEAQH